MPLYALPWQDQTQPMVKERDTMVGWLAERLRTSQDLLSRLRIEDRDGILLGVESKVKDMIDLKRELESHGFKYTIPAHLAHLYDENMAPLAESKL